eukprot:scaffold10327_cov122-Isochrysis_galbana.AAC.1
MAGGHGERGNVDSHGPGARHTRRGQGQVSRRLLTKRRVLDTGGGGRCAIPTPVERPPPAYAVGAQPPRALTSMLYLAPPEQPMPLFSKPPTRWLRPAHAPQKGDQPIRHVAAWCAPVVCPDENCQQLSAEATKHRAVPWGDWDATPTEVERAPAVETAHKVRVTTMLGEATGQGGIYNIGTGVRPKYLQYLRGGGPGLGTDNT